MAVSDLQRFFHFVLSPIPWWHWLMISVLSIALALFLVMRKKSSLYGAIAGGLTLACSLVLLETAILARCLGYLPHGTGDGVVWGFGRFFQGSVYNWVELFSNFAVFIPFGFFLSESLSSSDRFGAGRCFGYAVLATFALSLCIECLQLLLHVGFFEVSDLVLNTVGGCFGACVSLLVRAAFGWNRKSI